MPRRALVAAVSLVPALAILAAAPAYAADHVICVNSSAGCDETALSISAAITAANGNAGADTILVGPGTYSDGPYTLNGAAHTVTLQGAGQGSTILTLPASASQQTYLTANDSVVRDLTVLMAGGANSNDVGLSLFQSTASHVSVLGSGTDNSRGVRMTNSLLSSSSVTVGFVNTTGVSSNGGNTVTDSVIAGLQGFNASSTASTDHLSRLMITASYTGASLDSGTIDIDDSVIDLGAGGNTVGLQAANFNAGVADKTIHADHVTVVGGGANSTGALAYSSNAGARQNSTVTLTNSIVRGPATSLSASATNNGAQGGPSTATVSVSYSDWATTGGTIGANGSGGVAQGAGNVHVDPMFVDAAGGDLHLAAGSPVVDAGDPAAGGPATDRDGLPRIADGDATLGAVRDMGAYERPDTTAPETTLLTGPSGPTADRTPTFTYTSEVGATFECQIDGLAFVPCSGPGASHTTAPLSEGDHSIGVRAVDGSGNTDATPATRSFMVDTAAPETTLLTGPTGPIADRTPTFTYTSEAGASFECQIDGLAFVPCSGPGASHTTAPLSQGKHAISVRAVDGSGNSDATPATRSFTVDTVAPTTRITRKPSKKVTTSRVTFAFSSPVAGARFQCRVDHAAYHPCASPKRVKVRPGKHTFSVRAIDLAGNLDATPATYVFIRRR